MNGALRNFSFMVLVALVIGVTAGCGKMPDTSPPENRSGDGPTTTSTNAGGDLQRLQGVWAVEAIEEPNGKWPLEDDEAAEMKKIRFQFVGNQVSQYFWKRWRNSSFKLDEKANPKVMIITELDEKGEPKKKLGNDFQLTNEQEISEDIYKFEGDLLIIAHSERSGATRPKEFKPQAPDLNAGTPLISVLKLKKSNEPIRDTTPSPASNSGSTTASSRPRPETSK